MYESLPRAIHCDFSMMSKIRGRFTMYLVNTARFFYEFRTFTHHVV